MLNKEENELLTQVGPGTPMGELLRRYWHPIAGLAEMQQYPTKLVKVLGESLVLYRDRKGRFGLIGDTCPHRRVSLIYGIPEEDGLRCPYHGWKFSREGRCLEMPAEPPESTFKDKVSISAYPVEELGGLIFAFLGPKPVPLLPRWDLLVAQGALREAGWMIIPCNWMQCMENSLDPVHVEWLHGVFDSYVVERMGRPDLKAKVYRHEKIGFDVFEHGIIKRRVVEGGSEQDDDWKAGHPILFPNILRSGLSASDATLQYRVPIDDSHTYQVVYKTWMPGEGVHVPKQEKIPYFKVPLPGLDENGQPQWELLDNNAGQDSLMWYTQGPVADRSEERLGESDVGIILYRKMLKEQLEKIQRGEDPINVFRDPEKNIYIDLPHEEKSRRGGYQKIQKSGRRRGNIGKYSQLKEQVEALFAEAAEKSEG
jgi:5,5'-dehydrodivanillate O-demethylase